MSEVQTRPIGIIAAQVAWLIVMVFGACVRWAPPPPSRNIDFRQTVQLIKGNNGLRVLIVPDREADMIGVDVRYEVGSAADPPGKEGLAHLVEHLMFQLKPWGENQPTVSNALISLPNSSCAGPGSNYCTPKTG
ncbi:MAG: insulinase family protein [Proteobacteria bacterium]|nr:insulinase family protein [Pseudomonadota bacterium]